MKATLIAFTVVGLVLLAVLLIRLLRRVRRVPTDDADPFSIPKPQRIETAIATLEQLLEETDDPVIREALQNRLEQLRAERQRWQHGGRKA
jgi:hypothetical protein